MLLRKLIVFAVTGGLAKKAWNHVRKDPPQIPRGGPYRLALTVESPFGADHFIAIASPKPMAALQRDLAALEGKPAAAEVATLLNRHLAGQPVEFGIHGVYSTGR